MRVLFSGLIFLMSCSALFAHAQFNKETLSSSKIALSIYSENKQNSLLEEWQLITSQHELQVFGKFLEGTIEIKVMNGSSERKEFSVKINDLTSTRISLESGEEEVLEELKIIEVTSLSELVIEVLM